jgi:hypothetical protein
MHRLIPALVLALAPFPFDSGRTPLAAPAPQGTIQEKPLAQEASKRQERVRDFVTAFFREDEKSLMSLSRGRLQSDLKAYFWIRRKIHSDQAPGPRAWKGEIRILRSARAKVLETEGEIVESEAEIFELGVDGAKFRCGLDDEGNAVLFNDAPK